MTGHDYHVTGLRDGDGRVDPSILARVFRAPWRSIELVTLRQGAEFGPRQLEDSEAMIYVTSGRGRATLDSGPVTLHEGIAMTLFKAERLHLEASDEALEFFFAEMGVSS